MSSSQQGKRLRAKAGISGEAPSQQQATAKKAKATTVAVVEAPAEPEVTSAVAEQIESTLQMTTESANEPVAPAQSQPKKVDSFADLYRTTVQQAYIGSFDLLEKKIDKPGSIVFALSLLKSKFETHDTQESPESREKMSKFREVVVYPQINILVNNSAPNIQEAVRFIVDSVQSDVESGNHCGTGGKFPLMKELNVTVFETQIGFDPFEWKPNPQKYHTDNTSKSLFDVSKDITYLLLNHPMFLFCNGAAKEEYIIKFKDTIYSVVVEEIERMKVVKAKEFEQRKIMVIDEIKEAKGQIVTLEATKANYMRVANETEEEIREETEKKKGLETAQSNMNAALESVSICLSNDLKKKYEDFKESSQLELLNVIQGIDQSILEKQKYFEEIKGHAQTSTQTIEELLTKKANLEAEQEGGSMQVFNNEDEDTIKLKIDQSINEYMQVFKPITDCIESTPSGKKDIMEFMKKLTESREVVQEGILMMKTCLEAFFEKETAPPQAPPPLY
jgi:hypothetical protein